MKNSPGDSCRILVKIAAGTLLTLSGTVHLTHPYAFTFSIASYRVVPDSWLTVVPFAVAGVTFATGVQLLVDRTPAILWFAAGLFAGFVLLQVQALVRGLDIPCGCFGFSMDRIGLESLSIPTLAAIGCCWSAVTRSPTTA